MKEAGLDGVQSDEKPAVVRLIKKVDSLIVVTISCELLFLPTALQRRRGGTGETQSDRKWR